MALIKHFYTHLILNVLIILDEIAEVNNWVPHVILAVETAAGLFWVFMLCYGNFVPEKMKRKKYQDVMSQWI